jgi:hypothetical protein
VDDNQIFDEESSNFWTLTSAGTRWNKILGDTYRDALNRLIDEPIPMRTMSARIYLQDAVPEALYTEGLDEEDPRGGNAGR